MVCVKNNTSLRRGNSSGCDVISLIPPEGCKTRPDLTNKESILWKVTSGERDLVFHSPRWVSAGKMKHICAAGGGHKAKEMCGGRRGRKRRRGEGENR